MDGNTNLGCPQVSGSIPAETPKTRPLKSIWIWANRPSTKGSKLLFLVIKAKWQEML